MSVVAYRAWRVTEEGTLGALGVKYAWRTGAIQARCALRRDRFHLPPNPGCRCGIYGWKRPIDPSRINRDARCPADEVAVGVVLLWGRMCDGERMTGYRAQYARIAALVPDAAGRLDRDRYPAARYYRDLSTMYADWDVSPELGWAADAP